MQDKGSETLAVGDYTIDKHFAAQGTEVTTGDPKTTGNKPTIFYGYPDNIANPSSEASYLRTLYSTVRPVKIYREEDSTFCQFEEAESGFKDNMSTREVYRASSTLFQQ